MLKTDRLIFLQKLFDLANGDEHEMVERTNIYEELGADRESLNRTENYLKGEGLIDIPAYGVISITHEGIKEIEKFLFSNDDLRSVNHKEKEPKFMELNNYQCNNCDSPIPSEIASHKFNICGSCGNLYPQCAELISNYFRIIHLAKELQSVSKLFFKSEFTAAVREAFIKLETIVREESGLKDLSGKDLMAKAFSFKMDKNTKKIIEYPKIKINDLTSISKIDEQEGMKLMAMGVMQGIRNVYMHSHGSRRLYYALQIITVVDLLITQVISSESIATCSEEEKP